MSPLEILGQSRMPASRMHDLSETLYHVLADLHMRGTILLELYSTGSSPRSHPWRSSIVEHGLGDLDAASTATTARLWSVHVGYGIVLVVCLESCEVSLSPQSLLRDLMVTTTWSRILGIRHVWYACSVVRMGIFVTSRRANASQPPALPNCTDPLWQ